MSAIALGGPGAPCSAMRVRRLLAGELAGADRLRAEEHLSACSRCQATRAELAEEQRELARSLPFERFAAGVAERMAARAERPAWRRALPLALAASLLAAVALPLLLRQGGVRDDGFRVKGAAGLALFADAPGGAREVRAGEPVPGGALRASVQPGGWRQAALLLLDEDGAATLYAGPAQAGPLPDAFEWIGRGPGTLVLLLSDDPLTPAEREAVAGGAAPPGRAEIIRMPLRREGKR